jgi:hypothetical protein
MLLTDHKDFTIMKNILFLISVLLPAILFSQNTVTVCNIPGVKADYNSLQGALDSVADNSILYLFPSNISYGGGIVKKKVAIYGSGFLLDQNSPPATVPNTYGVNIQYLDIKQSGSNSYIEGVQFNNITFTQIAGLPTGTPLQIDSASNVIISRCGFFPHGGGYFVTTKTTYNCIIRDCYFDIVESGEGNSSFILNDNNSGSTALQFRNNIITSRRVGMSFNCYNILANSDVTFINNTIIAAIPGSNFQNIKYVNNIFVDTNPSGSVTPAGVFMLGEIHNNISNRRNFLDSTSNNYGNANPDSLFVYSSFGFHSEDQQWQLLTNSFANTYGTGGIACGAFGGDKPYTLSGIPDLPNIYNVTILPDPNVRGNVLVSIKAKASN